MKDTNIVRYTLRVNAQLFKKFRYVADYYGRSANRDLEQYIRKRVQDFEQKHGEIPVDSLKGEKDSTDRDGSFPF